MSKRENKELSICIPCKDSSSFLGKMLESIVSQKDAYGNVDSIREKIEVVFAVEHDNDFDKTCDLIHSWAEENSIDATVVPSTEGTAGGTRNVAASVARGRYITYFDSDDWLDSPLALYNILRVLVRHDNVPCVEWYFDGPFPYPNSRGMCWLRALRRDIALRHPFPLHSDQEDREMYQGVLDDPEYVNSVVLPFKLYYYNFGRKGSLSGTEIHPVKKEYDLTLFKKHMEEKEKHEQKEK